MYVTVIVNEKSVKMIDKNDEQWFVSMIQLGRLTLIGVSTAHRPFVRALR